MATRIDIPKRCVHCGSDNVVLRAQRISNGDLQFAWRCLDCHRWAQKPPQWLPHHLLRRKLEEQNATFSDIPVINDYSKREQCAVRDCDEPAEVHHLAPQALQEQFGDEWYKWPTIPLCRKHHLQWHRIVTPHLVQVGAQWHDE